MAIEKIKGGRVLILGDLHLTSAFEGQHKDYTRECYEIMDEITKKVDDAGASAVIFLGDLIGRTETNLKDRQFLMRVMLFLKRLNVKTGGKVYSVKGNHDFGAFSDFDMMCGLGYLKNVNEVDYLNDSGELEVRFHLVNYGDEKRELKLPKTEKGAVSNVVLAHADFHIEGTADWYIPTAQRLDLDRMKNFRGVDLVICGHIHHPSQEILYGAEGIGLFYVGSPTRSVERIEDCWVVSFEYVSKDSSTEYKAEPFGLRPVSEVFYPKEAFDITGMSEEEIEALEEQESRLQRLEDIVSEIIEGRLTTGDIFAQVRAVPVVEDRIKDIACDYLRKAIDE